MQRFAKQQLAQKRTLCTSCSSVRYPDAHHYVDHVRSRKGEHEFAAVAQRSPRVVPRSGGQREFRVEAADQCPADGHDVRPCPVMRRHQDDRAALQPGIAKLKYGFGLKAPPLPLRRHILHPMLQQQ